MLRMEIADKNKEIVQLTTHVDVLHDRIEALRVKCTYGAI